MARPRSLLASAGTLLTALAACGVAPLATAGTITLAGSAPNRTLTFTAAAGEVNAVVLRVGGGNYTLIDSQAIGGSTTCTGEGTTTVTCADSSVDFIVLAVGDQGDPVDVEGTNDPVTVNGAGGDDQIELRDPLANNTNQIRAAVTANGDAGSDTISVGDASDPSGTIATLTATQLGAGGSDTLFGVGGSLAYGGAESLAVSFGGGGDNIRLLSTAAGTQTTLDAGGGGDVFGVSSDGNGTSGNLDGIDGALDLLGGAGSNALLIADETSGSGNTATLSTVAITGLAPVPITFSATGSYAGGIVVRGSDAAADSFSITGTPTDSTTEIRTLGGDDSVRVSSDGTGASGDLDAIGGALTVDLGAGLNTLAISDVSEAAPGSNVAVSVDADSIDGLAGASDASSIGYGATGGTIAALALATSASAAVAEQITVTSPNGALTLATGEGTETVELRATARPVVLQLGGGDDAALLGGDPALGADGIAAAVSLTGGAGSDGLTIDDTGDSSADTVTLADAAAGAGPTDNLFGSGGSLGYGELEALTLRAGSGNDALTVAATAIGIVTTVAGGGGDDAFALGTGGSVESIRGAVSLDGGDGVNTLAVNDTADTTPDSLTIGSVTLGAGAGDTFFGPGGSLAQTGMLTVTVTTGAGADRVALSGTPAASLQLGAGDDHVTLAPDTTLGGTVDAQTGTDTLDFSGWTATVFVDLGSGEATGTSGVAGFERVAGGAGNDTLAGQYAAASELVGRAGNDRLTGGPESDVLDGGPGDDLLTGSFGGDRFVVGSGGSDRIVDNAGKDTLDFSRSASGVVIDLALGGGQAQKLGKGNARLRLSGTFENVTGSRRADVIAGSGAANVLAGGAGTDTISGRRGDDRIDGGRGRDTLLEAADANMTLTPTTLVGLGKDVLQRVEAARLTGGVSANRIDSSAFRGPVQLAGGPGNDVLTGGPAADLVLGEDGDDRLDGGLGPDQASGGPGNDSIVLRDGKPDLGDGGESYDLCVCDVTDRLLNVESTR